MKLRIAWVGKTKERAVQDLTDEYLTRLSRYSQSEGRELKSEEALFEMLDKEPRKPTLVLLDQRGRQFTSEEFAELLNDQQERATALLIFAVGPADGFSEAARHRANLILSFGKMTLAHEIARVVLVEQLYRAFTILKKHPYHTGH
jgi:23S rRNA (pseudouridine1915-N3)-methyltransferase